MRFFFRFLLCAVLFLCKITENKIGVYGLTCAIKKYCASANKCFVGGPIVGPVAKCVSSIFSLFVFNRHRIAVSWLY